MNKLSPTMKLKWFYASDKEEETIPCGRYGCYYPEVGTTNFVLKQWWEDKAGNGEWKNIEVE